MSPTAYFKVNLMIIFAYIWCRNCKLQVGNHWVHPVRNIDSITYSNLCTERIKNLSFTENICETSVVEYLCLFYDTYSCLRSNNLSVIMVTACGAESNRAAKLLWGHAIFLRWFTLWFSTWSLQLLHQKYAKVIIEITFNLESKKGKKIGTQIYNIQGKLTSYLDISLARCYNLIEIKQNKNIIPLSGKKTQFRS